MALKWFVKTKKKNTSGFSWSKWYQENKIRLAEKRKKRYKEDESYRQAALDRSKNQKKNKEAVVDDEYCYSFNAAAEYLGVTVWTIREWRKKNYFPQPVIRKNRFLFKKEQVDLLARLVDFFKINGNRTSESNKESLEWLINLIFANWQ